MSVFRAIFSNEGITGLVILNNNEELIEIDTFLLSCRILKRGVEKAIFMKLEELYPNKGIIGKYIPTSSNIQTKELYTTYNFAKIDDNNFLKNGR